MSYMEERREDEEGGRYSVCARGTRDGGGWSAQRVCAGHPRFDEGVVGKMCVRAAPEMDDNGGRHRVGACSTRGGEGGWSVQSERACVGARSL